MRFSGFQNEKIGTQSPGVIAIHGFVTVGGTGAITAQNVPGGGLSIARSNVGRYTLTLVPPAAESVAVLANLTFMGGWATVLGVDSAAMGAGGMNAFFRDDDISQSGAKDGTIELQFATNATTSPIDAELQSGVSFYFCIYIGSPAVQ